MEYISGSRGQRYIRRQPNTPTTMVRARNTALVLAWKTIALIFWIALFANAVYEYNSYSWPW